jgi:hypothetical protein
LRGHDETIDACEKVATRVSSLSLVRYRLNDCSVPTTRASLPKFAGEQRAELQDPSSHRLVRDIQPELRQQIFDVAITESEPDMEPNGVPDDRRREMVARERDPSCGHHRHETEDTLTLS